MFRRIDQFVEIPTNQESRECLEFLAPVISRNVFIGGGFAKICTTPNPPRRYWTPDIDIFPCTWEDYGWALEKIEHILGPAQDVQEDKWSRTLNELEKFPFPYRIQLAKPTKENRNIRFDVPDIESILSCMDYTVCRVGIINPRTAIADYRYIDDESNMKIRIVDWKTRPWSRQLERMVSYMGKGYSFHSEDVCEILKHNSVFVSTKELVVRER